LFIITSYLKSDKLPLQEAYFIFSFVSAFSISEDRLRNIFTAIIKKSGESAEKFYTLYQFKS